MEQPKGFVCSLYTVHHGCVGTAVSTFNTCRDQNLCQRIDTPLVHSLAPTPLRPLTAPRLADPGRSYVIFQHELVTLSFIHKHVFIHQFSRPLLIYFLRKLNLHTYIFQVSCRFLPLYRTFALPIIVNFNQRSVFLLMNRSHLSALIHLVWATSRRCRNHSRRRCSAVGQEGAISKKAQQRLRFMGA